MKRYKFELVIEEGSDEFWEQIKGSGADEVADCLEDVLAGVGFFTGANCTLTLREFTQ